MVDEEVAAVWATDGAADPGQRHAGALEGGGSQGWGPHIRLVDDGVTCRGPQSIVIRYSQEIVLLKNRNQSHSYFNYQL